MNYDAENMIEGLVLVPSSEALIQDLGPFLSGHLMETDILPGSALVCLSDSGSPRIEEDSKVRFAFEGNAYDACNLRKYYERCQSAAGRLAARSPSIAYGFASPEHLTVVARMNLLTYMFTEIVDPHALEAWSGEQVEDFIPPSDIKTPTKDTSITSHLCTLPMKPIAQGTNGIFVWSLLDGTMLTMDISDRQLTAWKSGDEGLKEVLEQAGIGLAEQFTRTP